MSREREVAAVVSELDLLLGALRGNVNALAAILAGDEAPEGAMP